LPPHNFFYFLGGATFLHTQALAQAATGYGIFVVKQAYAFYHKNTSLAHPAAVGIFTTIGLLLTLPSCHIWGKTTIFAP
jgi:hypothetical protein